MNLFIQFSYRWNLRRKRKRWIKLLRRAIHKTSIDLIKFKDNAMDLLDVRPVRELLEILDLEEGDHYRTMRNDGGISFFRISLESREAQALQELIKDVEIYVPQPGYYLTDFLFMRRKPAMSIVKLFNMFSAEELFSPFMHTAKIMRMQEKYKQQ